MRKTTMLYSEFYIERTCTTCYNVPFICGAKPCVTDGKFRCSNYKGMLEYLEEMAVNEISYSINKKILQKLAENASK